MTGVPVCSQPGTRPLATVAIQGLTGGKASSTKHTSSLWCPAHCHVPGDSSKRWVLLGSPRVRVRPGQAPLSDLSFPPEVSEGPSWFHELAGQTGTQGRSPSFLSLTESLLTRGCEGHQPAPHRVCGRLWKAWRSLSSGQRKAQYRTWGAEGWEGIRKDTENQ